jgi:tetratricopeptide (TPR) repeat protein
MRRCLITLASAVMCSAVVSAQDTTMPVVRILQQGDRSATIRLQTLRVDVKIVGRLATTTWDMTVHNPQNRVLEGELVFPVGEGQTVSRFAMDVNGRLREGVVVERDKGRQAFEEIVRRGVDPGLLEKTAGNSFRARVYPIPANGTKHVVIAYEQELNDIVRDTFYGVVYRLPMAFTDKVDVFSLRVEVLDQHDTPRLQSSPLANFAFKAWQRAYVAEETQRDVVPNKALTLVVPRGEADQRVFVGAEHGQQYFYATVSPRLSRQPKPPPRRLLIVWDASASARARNRAKELQLLDAYIGRLAGADLALAIFRNVMEPARHGSWAELRPMIEGAALDGATSPGAIDLAKEPADEVLLFSDGVATLGGGEPRLPGCPVVAFNTSQVAEHAWLRSIAEASGGEYLNLATTTVNSALEALATRPLAFLRATFDSSDVGEVYPSHGTAIRGPFGLAGRLLKSRARITLHFGYGDRESSSRSIEIDAKASVTAPVARIWAQKKLAELELDPTRNAAAILALGQQHGIVTRGTSLIVLDRLEDYVRYRIIPPDELRAEYDRRMKDRDALTTRQEKDHLERLIAQFEERKTWWRTEFKPGPRQDTPVLVTGGGRNQAAAEGRSEALAAAAPRQESPASSMDGLRGSVQAAKEASSVSPASRERELSASIALKAWSPDTPYLKELKAAARDLRYRRYLALREEYGTTPGFFLDVSDFFRAEGDASLALRILSNLAELKLEDAALLRVLGYRLRQLGLPGLAVWTFEQVLALRSDEPQSHRDLALALSDAGKVERAVSVMWEVVRRPWDSRFPDINLIALGEMNAMIATAKTRPDTARIDGRLLENLPVDVRVVLNWDTPDSDMDLHIVDPRGEECFYSHKQTAIGGRISADVTTGYGPEEFLLKKAVPGTYQVRAKFFGTRQQTALGATTVILELYLRYGSGRMENKSITLRLDGPGRMVDVGSFVFDVREK